MRYMPANHNKGQYVIRAIEVIQNIKRSKNTTITVCVYNFPYLLLSLWLGRVNPVNLNWKFSGTEKISILQIEAQPRLKFPNFNS